MLNDLKEYYGQVIKSVDDLKTSTCSCDANSLPAEIKEILTEIDDEIIEKFYGCGSPIPSALNGKTVLDLGCGSGRDVYIFSKLVGEAGNVIGVDMTKEQLDVANKYVKPQMDKFGYKRTNVEFKLGYIEDLKTIGIADNSVDVITSNCVINLSPDKKSVFKEIFRVLKPGGELYFSDIFSGRRVPDALKSDPVLRGECLSGAMYVEDFRRLMTEVGFADYRLTESVRSPINNPEIEAKIGMVDFYSMTVRAFKLDLEDICEDYGQVATYKGTISGHPHYFDLDDHHRFFTGKPMPVCGNTAAMVGDTRFGAHFKVVGDKSVHFGAFGAVPTEETPNDGGGCGC